MLLDDFQPPLTSEWVYLADTVMGGRSQGDGALLNEDGLAFARLTGNVTTANNGGFIQIRRNLPDLSDVPAQGIRLIVRGNDQPYFIHLRTGQSIRPWAYYAQSFDAPSQWQEVRLPFADFEPSARFMSRSIDVGDLKTLGIVAYGRDHVALLDVAEVGLY